MSNVFSESCDLASISFPRSTLMRNSTNLLYTRLSSVLLYVYAGKDRVGCRQPHLTPHYKVQSWQIVQTLQLYYDRLRFPFYYLKNKNEFAMRIPPHRVTWKWKKEKRNLKVCVLMSNRREKGRQVCGSGARCSAIRHPKQRARTTDNKQQHSCSKWNRWIYEGRRLYRTCMGGWTSQRSVVQVWQARDTIRLWLALFSVCASAPLLVLLSSAKVVQMGRKEKDKERGAPIGSSSVCT